VLSRPGTDGRETPRAAATAAAQASPC
jgi:hypothetical protein